MNMTSRLPSLRDRLTGLSLRTKLILANLIITLLALAGMGYYVYFRAQAASAYLTQQLDQNIRQQAEDKLISTSSDRAALLDNFFISMRDRTYAFGATAHNLLAHEASLNSGSYWDAAASLSRLPQSGSWDNPASDPGSVFIPARVELTAALLSELNTIQQLDFYAPTTLQSNPDITAIYFGGIFGETLYYPNIDLAAIVPPDFDVTQRPWFLKAIPVQNPQLVPVWSDPYLDAALHGLVITSSIPVLDGSGTFRGVAAMDIQLNQITQIVSNIKVGQTGYAFLLDKDKRLIAMPDSGYVDFGISPASLPLGEILDQTRTPTKFPPEFLSLLSNVASGKTGFSTMSFQGSERFIAYQPVPSVGYGLVIIVPSNELLAGSIIAQQQVAQVTRNTLTASLFLVVAILLLAFLATLGIGNSLTRPLRSLTTTAQEFANGNLDAEASASGRDEIGTLARTLNSMSATIRRSFLTLEQRVADRTAALEVASKNSERRAAQFEALSLVTRAISSIRAMEELLPRITSVISEQFGYYHIGIFVNDQSNQFAILTATNSEGGKRMLERSHRLIIGEQGIVGYVAATGETRVARNVGEDAVFFDNPDLPRTQSEMALPIKINYRIGGVLDVQSDLPDAFSQEDINVLSILVDQVSLAIENARLFEATRKSLAESEALYRQYLRQSWSRLPREKQLAGYRSSLTGAIPMEIPVSVEDETPESRDGDSVKKKGRRLIVPIKLRGETIGTLIVQSPRDTDWSQDQTDLAQAVADRVALSAENARLFDETSRRAERERLVTEITSKIRSTNNPEEMIRTALDELRNALGATQVQLIPQTISGSGDSINSTRSTLSGRKTNRDDGVKI